MQSSSSSSRGFSSNTRPASSSPSSNSEKQSVQLPTICYPSQLPPAGPQTHPHMGSFLEAAGAVAPQFRSRGGGGGQFPGQLQYCRTATFTQLQVAQATFRYPPTPPVDLADSLQQQQQQQAAGCEPAPTLSHIGYPPLPLPANGDVLPTVSTCSSEKFSLPTPPDLVPISTVDMDSSNPPGATVSPSTGHGGLKASPSSSSSYYYQLPWQQGIATTQPDLPSVVGDANHHCLATHSHIQAWSGSESASPSPLSLVQQQRFFFQLPQAAAAAAATGQYGGDGEYTIPYVCSCYFLYGLIFGRMYKSWSECL